MDKLNMLTTYSFFKSALTNVYYCHVTCTKLSCYVSAPGLLQIGVEAKVQRALFSLVMHTN